MTKKSAVNATKNTRRNYLPLGGVFTRIVLFSTLVLFPALTFTSCENFLNGADFKKQLEEDIAYAKATPFTVYVKPEKGSGTVVKPASEETTQKVTDSFAIQFDPSSDYEFLCWQAESVSLKQNESIYDYISIENKEASETVVTLKKELSDIIIKPVVAKRAQIISWSPVLSSEFSLRDSPITVIFDKPMSEDSIYFDAEEIQNLKETLSLTDDDFLHSKTDDSKIYGYKKEGEKFFKNILISDAAGKVMNEFYSEPVFNSDRTSLIVDVNLENLPLEFSQIAVTIDRGFYYKAELDGFKKDISLSQEKKWLYSVSDVEDNDPPEIIKAGITINSKNIQFGTMKSDYGSTYYSMLEQREGFVKGDKLNFGLDFLVKDEGVGLKGEFDFIVTQIGANNEGTYEVESKKFTLLLEGNNLFGSYKGNLTIPLHQYAKDSYGGLYKIEYYFYDRKNRKNNYFLYYSDKDQKERVEVKPLVFILDNSIDDVVNALNNPEKEPGLDDPIRVRYSFPQDLKTFTVACSKSGEDCFGNKNLPKNDEGKVIVTLLSEGMIKENEIFNDFGSISVEAFSVVYIIEEINANLKYNCVTFTLKEKDAKYDFTFYAEDLAGNTVTKEVSITADLTAVNPDPE